MAKIYIEALAPRNIVREALAFINPRKRGIKPTIIPVGDNTTIIEAGRLTTSGSEDHSNILGALIKKGIQVGDIYRKGKWGHVQTLRRYTRYGEIFIRRSDHTPTESSITIDDVATPQKAGLEIPPQKGRLDFFNNMLTKCNLPESRKYALRTVLDLIAEAMNIGATIFYSQNKEEPHPFFHPVDFVRFDENEKGELRYSLAPLNTFDGKLNRAAYDLIHYLEKQEDLAKIPTEPDPPELLALHTTLESIAFNRERIDSAIRYFAPVYSNIISREH